MRNTSDKYCCDCMNVDSTPENDKLCADCGILRKNFKSRKIYLTTHSETRERLEQALNIIRGECREHEECLTCPLRTRGGNEHCSLRASNPDEWILRKDNKYEDMIFE